MRLLSFGEVLFDIHGNDELLGGAPLNLAAHAAIQGAESYILSCVGKDDLGKNATEQIKALGVRTEYLFVSNELQTGKCIVSLNNAIPSYNLLENVAYDRIPSVCLKKSFDVLAFGTLSLRSPSNVEALKQTLKENVFKEIYCDLNIRPPFYSEQSVRLCLENATVVKISDDELSAVTRLVLGTQCSVQEAAALLTKKFNQIKLMVITLGSKGSYALDSVAKKEYACPAFPANVVSTVGAGDSFGATLLVRRAMGDSIERCLTAASRVSAFVVSKSAAIPQDTVSFIRNADF